MFVRVAPQIIKKKVYHIDTKVLQKDLATPGKFKVFLEGVPQNHFFERAIHMTRVTDRLKLLEGGFAMERKENDSNPFPQVPSLNTRFEIAPRARVPTDDAVMEFNVSCTFTDEQFESTFFQCKYFSKDNKEKLVPLFALDTREEAGIVWVHFRHRNPLTGQLIRYKLFPYEHNTEHLFQVELDFKNKSAEVRVDGVLHLVWESKDSASFVPFGNGDIEIALGMYATDYTMQKESILFHYVTVNKTFTF